MAAASGKASFARQVRRGAQGSRIASVLLAGQERRAVAETANTGREERHTLPVDVLMALLTLASSPVRLPLATLGSAHVVGWLMHGNPPTQTPSRRGRDLLCSEVKIVVYGGSVSVGYPKNCTTSYPERLVAWLEDTFPGGQSWGPRPRLLLPAAGARSRSLRPAEPLHGHWPGRTPQHLPHASTTCTWASFLSAVRDGR